MLLWKRGHQSSACPHHPHPCVLRVPPQGRGAIPVLCGATLVPAEFIYSQGAADLGVLLTPPHLQEVQDFLGQLLIVIQHTLQCSRGFSTPKNPSQTHHRVFLSPKNSP